ncbi:hypothetical protein C6I20_09910 [Aeromicrobium sp. A1-2]|uniref:hypothetical protein n=1 Tax=Aeromicrobium sp. A1-2 TaxID=2107713 RepID=UPI000E4F26D7|nr:hypothetical protein [Aeromicrobium sp. A1-2]AXT85471.1 hypothetical protein C6I20_09910 [Aeromicrobium sp. A1-2]
MTARPVPVNVDPTVMYAVMTPRPLESKDLIPPPSPELLRHYGSSDLAMRRLRSRPHQHLILRQATLEDVAFMTRDARIDALLLAEQHDGLVIDLSIPRVVEHRSDEVSLAHATQWYVVSYDDLAEGRLRTIGLTSFGLPEAIVLGVDEQTHAMFSAVLAGLVHRLLAEWPANDPVGSATVTLRDIAYGLGDAEAASTPRDRAIDIDVAYDADDNLLLITLQADPAETLFAP